MMSKHGLALTDEQLAAVERWEAQPRTRRDRNRALILLRAADGQTDAEIVETVGVSPGTVANVRKQFVNGGLEGALCDKPRPGAKPILDGKAEAIVIATACSAVPERHAVWTARMLANRLVELEIVERVSEDTIPRVLKKASWGRGRRKAGVCPRA